MAIMSGIYLAPTAHDGGRFTRPAPIGIVCHRTECPFDQARAGFQRGPKSIHFLIGKTPGNVAQIVDTGRIAYHVGPKANNLFLGIEFESRTAGKAFAHSTDPAVNADPLTLYQLDLGREIINWLCKTHNIPKNGPPCHSDMVACRGHYRGLMNHASLNKFFETDHGDALRLDDWAALLPMTGQLGDFPFGATRRV